MSSMADYQLHLLSLKPIEGETNPYSLGGELFAPPVLYRVLKTPADVAAAIREGELVYSLSSEDVALRADVELDVVRHLEESGTGSLDDLFAVLKAANVEPVSVPFELLTQEGLSC